jgi:hypothetical protein
MKKYLKAAYMTTALILLFSGCSGNSAKTESSAEEISVVSRSLTYYEKQVLNDSVEMPLQNACRTLYEGVCKGSITKESVAGKFSFSYHLPSGNTSPNQKIKAAELLTVRDAVEYFSLGDIYTNENIREYGYMTADYTDISFLKGTVINISKFQAVSEDFTRFGTLDTPFGSFISSRSLQ